MCSVTRSVLTVRSCKHLDQPPKLEDHPLSAVRDCFFNIFAATLHTRGRSSTRNEDAPCRGDRDPLTTDNTVHGSQYTLSRKLKTVSCIDCSRDNYDDKTTESS